MVSGSGDRVCLSVARVPAKVSCCPRRHSHAGKVPSDEVTKLPLLIEKICCRARIRNHLCITELPGDQRLRRWGPVDILTAKDNRAVVLKLLRHMAAVAVGPVGTFVLVRDLQPPGIPHRDARAAVAAVLVLNLLIALYVIMAFQEPEPSGGTTPPVVVRRLGRWKERRAE
ncbi:hypothetical protein CTAYLR_006999 [Chrysophaeum taylorii]|uniref:Uncharacterized protein n=1 Tax=Chrysophaeum taylorii TaxID=2483200 RepID=A0AAD7U9Q1_9STRA|nr:hypothetical protein CTAYLR_006999 [Chrysophaeum taylorii]